MQQGARGTYHNKGNRNYRNARAPAVLDPDDKLEDLIDGNKNYNQRTGEHRYNYEKIELCCKRDQNNGGIKETTSDGRFLIKLARNFRVLEALKNHGLNLDARDEEGNTGLHYAVKDGNSYLVQCYLEVGADPNISNDEDNTSFDFALKLCREGGKSDIGSQILDHLLACERTTFSKAAIKILILEERTQLLEKLVTSSYCQKHQKSWLDELLHYAVKNAKLSSIRVLLQCGADINAKDHKDKTVFNHSSTRFNSKLSALLNQYSDATLALLHAVQKNDTEETRRLLAAGHSPDIQDPHGKAPLHIAAANENIEIMKLLIAKKALVDIKTRKGEAPLHIAASNGNTEAIKVLMQAKAHVNAETLQGKTPLHIAIENGREPAMMELMRHGAITAQNAPPLDTLYRAGREREKTRIAEEKARAQAQAAKKAEEAKPAGVNVLKDLSELSISEKKRASYKR